LAKCQRGHLEKAFGVSVKEIFLRSSRVQGGTRSEEIADENYSVGRSPLKTFLINERDPFGGIMIFPDCEIWGEICMEDIL
jgi:hypothetical protein